MHTDTGIRASRQKSEYRVKPSLTVAVIVVLLYMIFLNGLQYFSGVTYTEVGKSITTLTRFALIPIGSGAVVLTIFAIASGWWADLWHDKYKITKPAWLSIFALLMIVTIASNFASGNIFSNSLGYLFVAALAMACVGYSEEILFRGIVLRGARGSGFSEKQVMLAVMLAFGLFHLTNLLLGSPLFAVLFQVVQAGITGGALYMVFRKSGTLVIPMVLHAFIDFSLFTKGTDAVTSARNDLAYVGLVMPLVYAILLVLVLKYVNVGQGRKQAQADRGA